MHSNKSVSELAGLGGWVFPQADVGIGGDLQKGEGGLGQPDGSWGPGREQVKHAPCPTGGSLEGLCLEPWPEAHVFDILTGGMWVCVEVGSPRQTEPQVGPGGPTNYRAGSQDNHRRA